MIMLENVIEYFCYTILYNHENINNISSQNNWSLHISKILFLPLYIKEHIHYKIVSVNYNMKYR